MPDFTPHEAPARTAQALPVMLPGKLVGRDAQLAQVYSQLKNNKPVLIYGAAGAGKTALAATLASAYTELPGGVVWLNLNDSSLEDMLVRIGRSYQVAEIQSSDNPAAMVGAVASTLTTHKPLLVLDGSPNPTAVADFVRRCAEGLPVMLLADEQIEGPWAGLQIENLDEDAALELFTHHAGLANRADLQDDIDELVGILDYNPFALSVAAGTLRVSKQSPAAYLEMLEKIPSSAAAEPPLLALTLGFRGLNNALQGLLLMMGATFNGQGSAEMLSMIAGAPIETLQQVMVVLQGASLVERFQRYDMSYYRLHEITQGFAQQWLSGSGQLEVLRNKAENAILDYARKYSTDSPQAHNKLAAEMETIMAAARHAADDGERDKVNQLVVSLMQAGDFVNERGYVYELLSLRQFASSFTVAFPAYPQSAPAPEDMDEEDMAADAESATPPRTLWDTVENRPAPPPREVFDGEEDEDEVVSIFDADEEDEDEVAADFDVDDEDEDEYEDSSLLDLEADADDDADDTEADPLTRLQMALRQARQSGNTEHQVRLLMQIGEQQVNHQMENEAIATYGEALGVYESLEDEEGILRTLDTLSTLEVKTDNLGAAVLHATRGLTLAENLGEAETQMHLYRTLGDARQQQGESNDATRAFGQALEIARTRGDSQNEALILYRLGYAQLDDNDATTASDTWEQALQLFKTQGKRAYEGRVMGGLGTAYGELGRWLEAINFHTSALHIAREVRNTEDEALELGNLGRASVEANQLGQAVLRYRQALHLAYQSGDRENIVSTIVDLVRLLAMSKRHLLIAELLIDDAALLEPNDRDVIKLKDRIVSEKALAQADGVAFLAVNGTAPDYALNAYKQLEA
ncbi:MAG: tetratricopeptide repeat protein [Anaerolineaceae bacterium]|nr:tetratricopeptide repeat protein [Anaerolineaceae bacterium]